MIGEWYSGQYYFPNYANFQSRRYSWLETSWHCAGMQSSGCRSKSTMSVRLLFAFAPDRLLGVKSWSSPSNGSGVHVKTSICKLCMVTMVTGNWNARIADFQSGLPTRHFLGHEGKWDCTTDQMLMEIKTYTWYVIPDCGLCCPICMETAFEFWIIIMGVWKYKLDNFWDMEGTETIQTTKHISWYADWSQMNMIFVIVCMFDIEELSTLLLVLLSWSRIRLPRWPSH